MLARWQAEDDRMEVTVLGRNGGSAGSFAAGLEAVLAKPGATHIAAFDDDAIPAPDCLERLLEAAAELGDGAGAIGAVSMDAGRRVRVADVHARPPRAGALDRRAGGGGGEPARPCRWPSWPGTRCCCRSPPCAGSARPRAELFMWYEDVEYGLRLRRAGLTAYAVVAAHVDHPPPKRVVRATILGVPLDVPIVSPSKAYLMTRNALVVRHEYVGPKFWVVDVPLTVARALIAIRALPGPKLKLLREALLRPIADAARGRMGPPPPSASRPRRGHQRHMTGVEDRYRGQDYSQANPDWHAEDSPWKAGQILDGLGDWRPGTVCEVGCGVGAVLRRAARPACPGAHVRGLRHRTRRDRRGALPQEDERLSFRLADPGDDDDRYDLMLVIDVIEHVADPIGFMAAVRPKAAPHGVPRAAGPVGAGAAAPGHPDGPARVGRATSTTSRRRPRWPRSATRATRCATCATRRCSRWRVTPPVARAGRAVRRRLPVKASVRWLGGYSLLVVADNEGTPGVSR